MPEAKGYTPNDDPIVGRSMSGALLISSLILLLTLVWALYEEFYGLRPWKAYQQRFVRVYSAYLQRQIEEQSAAEQAIRQQATFRQLEEQIQKAEQAAGPRVREIDAAVSVLNQRIALLTDVFANARGEVTALYYEAETAGSEAARQKKLAAIEEAKQGPFTAQLPTLEGTVETVAYNYDELLEAYEGLKDRRAQLLSERVRVLERATALRRQRSAYLEQRVAELSEQQLRGLLNGLRNFRVEIKQIHVVETDLVDRCESCHLGIREPLTLTPAALGGQRVFASHPDKELLEIHDPARFGCSPCHGGNGRAVASVQQAHGRYRHWLWPLYARENYQAGCQTCHARDMVVEHAEVLNRGKQLFRQRGCIGCHRYEGFDDQGEQLDATRREILRVQMRKASFLRQSERSIQAGDRAPTNEEAQRLYQRAENLRLRASGFDAEITGLRERERSLMREAKKVGPNLKEIRAKLRPEWIPVWIENPHAFRPTTKMPRFRLEPDQVRALAAFIWQSALPASVPRQPRGNPARGQQLFESRGCLACHAVGEGEDAVGGTFAANLSRLGEKANYDYIVRWVHNPRDRLRPYCPLEKRDLTPEDYRKHGLPFRFDLERMTCPNDGAPLVVHNRTVMPNLRLTWQDARDIASYLVTLRQKDPEEYAAADFLEDTSLFESGKTFAKHYGCAGCHEIAGLEDEDRIGTDLTAEGAKPIERLDFARHTHEAERQGWYNHKGFFEHKLSDPAFFDEGRLIENRLERLRMPKPNLSQDDVTALTTFLLGSVDPGYGFPASYLYRPNGQRKDIQEGWWLITKYNCIGCHQVRVGQESALMTLPQYQSPEGREQLPPNLIGAGARLNPEWLARFLTNPALSQTNLNRNGVRTYLQVRMPTFSLTPNEIEILVRFFEAISAQPRSYLPRTLKALTPAERTMARQLFTHPAAPCLRCHATGDPVHDRTVNAPNFLLAKERLKPDWTKRWMLDPASLSPGTAMPSGLFRQEGERWVFAGPLPPSLRGYQGDHADLLVRYMFQITPAEQRRLIRQLSLAPVQPRSEVARNVVESDSR